MRQSTSGSAIQSIFDFTTNDFIFFFSKVTLNQWLIADVIPSMLDDKKSDYIIVVIIIMILINNFIYHHHYHHHHLQHHHHHGYRHHTHSAGIILPIHLLRDKAPINCHFVGSLSTHGGVSQHKIFQLIILHINVIIIIIAIILIITKFIIIMII